MSILNALRSEWILLNRKRLWFILGAITTLYTVVATALTISTAEPRLQQSEDGLALEALVGAGGATMAVISIAFAFRLVVVTFAASTGNDFTRGTLRAALTFQSNRVSLLAGKLAARVLVAAIVMAGALIVGSITAAIVAPAQDIGAARWFGLSALGDAVEDYLQFIDEVLTPFGARFRPSDPFRPTTIRSVHADGDTVVVLWDGRGIANDGQPYENSYAWFMKLRDDKVVDGTAFYDSISFNDLWTRVEPGS